MEFTNEIYFDKNLVENQKVKLYYTGKLFREFSSEAYIVYGYGPNWENTQEKQLNLTDENFNVEINITGKDTFNFCFRNNYNIWDNNDYQNYIATIFPQDTINSDKNSDTATDIETSFADIEEPQDSETSSEESSDTSTENFQNENSNDVFTELLESLLNDIDNSSSKTEIPYSENSYGLQNFGSIESTSSDSLNELFNELYAEYENVEPVSSIQNITETDLDVLFDKVFNYENTEDTKENVQEAQDISSELEELMNNILNSVLESDSINDNIVDELDAAIDNQVSLYEKENSQEIQQQETSIPSEDNKKYEDLANAQVPAVIQTSKIDLFFDASVKFLQNLGVACKKLGELIKLKAQELGFIKEDN